MRLPNCVPCSALLFLTTAYFVPHCSSLALTSPKPSPLSTRVIVTNAFLGTDRDPLEAVVASDRLPVPTTTTATTATTITTNPAFSHQPVTISSALQIALHGTGPSQTTPYLLDTPDIFIDLLIIISTSPQPLSPQQHIPPPVDTKCTTSVHYVFIAHHAVFV